MKIRVFWLILLLLSLTTLGHAVDLVNEGFEGSFPPTGWTNSGWTQVTSPYTGIYSAGSSSTTQWLSTPLLANPGILSYWHRKDTGNASFSVQVGTNIAGPWTTPAGYPVYAGGGWTLGTLDLSSYTNIYVRWLHEQNDNSIFLDHVVITEAATAPTIQATNVNFTNVQTNQVTVNWTRGNGSNIVVFARESSVGTPGNPVDGTTYTTSTNWSSKGTELGASGYYCIYNGAGNSVTLTDLLAGTNYYAIAYEYNGTGVSSVYMSGGATGNTTTLAQPPLINVTGTLTNFGSVKIGNNSTEQTYSVSASNLTANLILTAPTGFQVSTTSGSGFGSSVTLTPVSGTVNATTIFVRFTPIFTGVSSGNITNASTNATTQNVAVSGTGINIPAITDPTSASITSTTAVLGGNITSLNSSSVTERGIYYSTINGFADGAGIKISEFGSYSSGLFTLSVTGLSQGITYYFKAFATNAAGTSYTTQYSFTTLTSTYTVDITSTPTDADIFIGGIDSGFNTPHQFTMNAGANATYTLQKAGYTWSPESFVITNIQANTSQNFTGTIIDNVNPTISSNTVSLFADGTPQSFVFTINDPAPSSGINWTSASLSLNPNTGITIGTGVSGTWAITIPTNSTIKHIDATVSVSDYMSNSCTYHRFVNVTPIPAISNVTITTVNYEGSNAFFVPGRNLTVGFNLANPQRIKRLVITLTAPDVTILNNTQTITSNINGTMSVIFNGVTTAAPSYLEGKVITATITGVTDAYASYEDPTIPGVVEVNLQGNSSTATINVDARPVISAPSSASITNTSAILGGNITNLNVPNVSERGIYYSTANGFANGTGTKVSQTAGPYGTGAYSVGVSSLNQGITYYFKAFAINPCGISYSTQSTFTTLTSTYTVDITSTPTDADIYVDGVDSGFNTPHQFVIDYGTSAAYTLDMAGYTWQPAELNITNIQANTSQFFQGNTSSPGTLPLSESFEGTFPPPGWTVTDFTQSSTFAHTGTFSALGSTSSTGFLTTPLLTTPGVLVYWVCRGSTSDTPNSLHPEYATQAAPTTWVAIGSAITATTTWTQYTVDLSAYTNIYFRWRWNHTSILYIDDINVTNLVTPTITLTGSLVDFGSVKVGNISAEQSYSVSASNLTANLILTAPTGFQVSTTSGSGFGSSVTLTPVSGTVNATTIFVRFTPMFTGLTSGNITNASTNATTQNVAVSGTGINVPVITTPTSASITRTSAILGGNISNINLSGVIERGIYYSTINGFADGSGTKVYETGSYGTGIFTLNVSGLSMDVTYYFKAYASNAAGTGYSIQSSFTTLVNNPPIVTLPESITIHQNEITTVDFSDYLSDPDGDSLSLTISGNTNVSIQINGFVVTFHPGTNWTGSEILTFSVNDSISNRRTIVSAQVTIHVINPLVIDFSSNSTLNNNVVANDPQTTLTFSVTSNFTLTSLQWDFDNDNIIDSELPSPTYLFTTPGYKTVTLTASDSVHVTTIIKANYINVLQGTLVPPQLIATDIIWTEAGGPYNISGELILNSGINLIVEPNAQVNLMVDSLLIINGTINAQDAFFNAYGPNGWGGMVINPSSNNSIINGINLYGAATGITINGCNPTLSNIEMSGNSSARTITTGITINANAAPAISNIRIINFNQGLIATNLSATQQALNLTELNINRQSNEVNPNDIGILINGNYNVNLQDIAITDYPYGVEIINETGTGRPVRLSNSRVIKTESSTRTPSTAIRIVNPSYAAIVNDSLIGFTKGIEIENTNVTPADLRIANNTINYNALIISPDFAIKVTGNATGYLDSLMITGYSTGIWLNGNQAVNTEHNTLINCGSALQDNQNHQNHQFKRNTIYRNAQFNGIAGSPAMLMNQSTNLTAINNTFYNYPIYVDAAGASNLSYEQNIAWCTNPNANPIILTDGSIIIATYNDIALPTGTYQGIGNINANPWFAEVDEGDFSLTEISPCINSGNPANPHDPDGTIADIGSIALDITTIPLVAEFTCDFMSGQHPLTVHFTNNSTHFTISSSWDFNSDNIIDSNEANPVWTYTTPGIYTVKLTVWDGLRYQTKLCPDLITVQNSGPIITAPMPDITRAEDFPSFQIDLSNYFSDTNGDPLAYSFVKDSDYVIAVLNQNILTISSVPNQHGLVNFTVTADDSYARHSRQNSTVTRTSVPGMARKSRISVSDTFTLTITPVNDAPVIILPETFTSAEDSSLVINMAQYVSDIDNTVLTLSAQNSAHISVEIDGLNATLSVDANWFGTEQLTFSVNDNSGRLIAADSTLIIVTSVNDLPVITSFTPQQQTITVQLGETCTFEITASDIDSPLQYSWYINDSLQGDSDNSFTCQFDTSAVYNVKVVVSDGEYNVLHNWVVTTLTENDDNLQVICTALNRIYPNPFNSETSIDYQLKNPIQVKIDVFNVKGQLISKLIDKVQPSGKHTVKWNIHRDKKNTLPNGIYYIRVGLDNHYEVRRVLLIK